MAGGGGEFMCSFFSIHASAMAFSARSAMKVRPLEVAAPDRNAREQAVRHPVLDL